MAPYNKRKREHQGGHDFRPRLSPAEQRALRIRKGIAEIGEPSRIGREVMMQNLSDDLREAQPESYQDILAITKAVVYEQPHKIGYLSFVYTDANNQKAGAAPSELPFLVLEMVHDELSRAVNAGDYDRFKVFLRFLCALAPIIENTDELVRAIDALMVRVNAAALPTTLKTQLYKTALLAAVYLPEGLVNAELQAKLVDVTFPESAEDGLYDYFFGDEPPFETQSVGSLLVEAARKLKDNGWNVDFLARNPLDPGPAPELEAPSEAEPVDASTTAVPEPAEVQQTEEQQQAEENPTEEQSTNEQSTNEQSTEEQPKEPGTTTSESGAQESSDPQAEQSADSQPVEEPASTVSGPVKHRIREIHLPDPLPNPSQKLHSDAFCRIYLPTNGVQTVPEPANMMGLLLRDVAVDVIRHIDFNRREVTRQLIALDMFFNQRIFAPPGVPLDTVLQYSEGEPTWKIEDMALEAIYSQMFDLSADGEPFPLVYYHTLLVEACVMAPQDIAPVLGRALRFLFNHFMTADAELLFRAVDWFAHHVSNFAFTWKWNEWIDTLQLSQFHPQQVFVRELLAKQVRLSYPQRVRDVLPEEFQPLVPDTPDMPPFKFAQDEKVLRFVDALQNPAEASPEALLEEFEPEKRTDVLITCVCDLGNRSLTHASNWVAKTVDLVRKFVTDETKIVESVFAYWQQSQWIGALITSQFIKNQLVSPQTFVDFVVSDPELLLSSVGWEALSANVEEARKALEGRKIDEEWGDWWLTRLNKALGRRKLTQNESAMDVDDEGSGNGDVDNEAQDETDYEPRLNSEPEEVKAGPEGARKDEGEDTAKSGEVSDANAERATEEEIAKTEEA